jgi:hypothetical protein
MRFLTMYRNCPSVMSSGTKYLVLEMTGTESLADGALSQITGTLSGNLERIFDASSVRSSAQHLVDTVARKRPFVVADTWHRNWPPRGPLGRQRAPGLTLRFGCLERNRLGIAGGSHGSRPRRVQHLGMFAHMSTSTVFVWCCIWGSYSNCHSGSAAAPAAEASLASIRPAE